MSEATRAASLGSAELDPRERRGERRRVNGRLCVAVIALLLVAACGLPAGTACAHPTDCGPGATCVLPSEGGVAVCAPLCQSTAKGATACPSGKTCEEASEFGCCLGTTPCTCASKFVCR